MNGPHHEALFSGLSLLAQRRTGVRDHRSQADKYKPPADSTSLQHLFQDAPESVVLQGGGDALLVGQLLVDLVILGVAVLLAADDDAVVGRQDLLQAHADAQAEEGRVRAVGDGGRDVHADLDDDVGVGDAECRRRLDADVRQVDDGQLAERDGMLRVCDGSDEVLQVGS